MRGPHMSSGYRWSEEAHDVLSTAQGVAIEMLEERVDLDDNEAVTAFVRHVLERDDGHVSDRDIATVADVAVDLIEFLEWAREVDVLRERQGKPSLLEHIPD